MLPAILNIVDGTNFHFHVDITDIDYYSDTNPRNDSVKKKKKALRNQSILLPEDVDGWIGIGTLY